MQLKKKFFTLLNVDNKDLTLLNEKPDKFWKKVEIVNGSAFLSCTDLIWLSVPSSVLAFCKVDFSNCNQLKGIDVDIKKTKILMSYDCFKYIYKYNNFCIFSRDKIDVDKNFVEINLESIEKCFGKVKINNSFLSDLNLDKWLKLSNTVEKNHVFLPYNFIERSASNSSSISFFKKYEDMSFPVGVIRDTREEVIDYFTNVARYKKFKNILKLNKENMSESDLVCLYKLGYALGLFEDNSKVIKVGKGVEAPVSSVAYTFLQGFFLSGVLKFSDLSNCFNGMNVLGYNEEFLKFMIKDNNIRDYKKLDKSTLCYVYDWFVVRDRIKLEEVFEDIRVPKEEKNRFKIMTYNAGKNGVYKERWNIPTFDLILDEMVDVRFDEINEDNRDLAKAFLKYKCYQQKHLDKAFEIQKEKKDKKVNDYIIDPVKESVEDSFKDYKERIKRVDEIVQQASLNIVCDQLESSYKIFTYEVLSKSDVANYFLGFYTSCCLALYGGGSGAQRAMIVDERLQPLVVRDKNGVIVASSILYINKEEGYGVINSIEINNIYEGDEAIIKEIFYKFKKMLSLIADNYNKVNSRPLKIITCGVTSFGKIKGEYFNRKKQDVLLKTPDFSEYTYGIELDWPGDWFDAQYVIWEDNKRKL